MKFAIILSIIVPFAVAYSEVNTILDCSDCMVTQNKTVCKDEANDRISYCCDYGEQTRGCIGRDFCSPQAKTISMRMFTCPFITRACGATSTFNLKPNITYSIVNSQATNRLFNQTAICNYKVTADLSNLSPTEAKTALININVKQYQHIFININNGTSLKLANDPVQVNTFNTGNNFNYLARNNIIYIVLAGTNFTDQQPSVNIQMQLLYLKDVAAPAYVPPVVISNTVFNVSYVNKSFFTEKATPQYQNYTLLAAIVMGTLVFMIADCLIRKPDDTQDFDILDNFQFSAREDDQNSKRQFISIITDQHLESYNTNQDLLENSKFEQGHKTMNSVDGSSFQFFKRALPTVRINQTLDNDVGVEMTQMPAKPNLRFMSSKVAPSDHLSKGELSIRSKNFNNNSSFERDDNSYVGLSGRTSRNKVVPMSIIQQEQSSSRLSQYPNDSTAVNVQQSYVRPAQNRSIGGTSQQNASSLGP